MRKIIALVADEDKGKTTTLNYLIDLLSSAAEASEIYPKSDNDTQAFYKINNNWIFVGTEGDETVTIMENIKETKKYDCSIGIIASQTSKDCLDTIKKETTSDGRPIKIIKKFNDIEGSLSSNLSNNAKNRIIAAKLFQEIFNVLVPELAEKKLMND